MNEWFAIASAELRTLRRLVRTWVFVALAAGLMGSAFYFHSYFHHSFPGAISRIDLLPRFWWGDINNYVLWLFMAAVVFLAFDTRHRDEQSGIREALDSRPLSNLDLFAGRVCGVAIAALAALFAVSVLLQVAATVGGAIGWVVYPIEPVAMLTFLVVDAVPAVVAWSAVVLLLVAFLGNRLVVAIVALALLGLHMWAQGHVPVYLLPAVSLLHIHDNWASDLAPRFADAQTYLHRGSLLLVAGGLLAWTAALHRRSDGVSRASQGVCGALFVVVGIGGIALVALRCIGELDLRATWQAAHQRALDIQTPHVRHLSGIVHINPGREMDLDLEMQLAAPSHADLPNLVFSFNPGLEVAALRVDDQATPFFHELGLLTVELPAPLAAGSPVTVALQAKGLPDTEFAYFDSSLDWRLKTSRNQILRLGTSAGIFASRYVALMPALRWLPVPGPNLDGASRGNLPTIDLSVAVPNGWLVAGPGRREADDAGRFRFRHGAPVPEIAIIAARFERRAIRIAGIDFELLFHPDHLGNVAVLADTRERLESRLAELLRQAEELGMPYPYDGFSLVEAPTHLREYGGGWALDSVMELPGVLLLKEHGFPYANFKLKGLSSNWESSAQRNWAILQLWFQTPNPGANASESLGRHVTTFQTHAKGPAASALDEVVEELAASLLDDNSILFRRSYSVYDFDVDDDVGARLFPIARFLTASTRTHFAGFGPIVAGPGRPSTWERMLGASLADLDMQREPAAAVEARSLRVGAAFRSIGDSVGRRPTAAFLAALRSRHSGAPFDANDFDDAAAQARIDLGALLGDWIGEVALPGFVTSSARVAEIADTEGNVLFQTRVHVRNSEPVPGLVRLSTGGYEPTVTDPVQIPGNTTMELGMMTDEAPAQLWLEPYLALNRSQVWIDIVTETSPPNPTVSDPLTGARPSVWMPHIEGIVVDDLDPGFTVEQRTGQPDVPDRSRQAFGGSDPDLDQGLPVAPTMPGEWYRATYPTSWGRYRHTVAGAPAGDGSQVAQFAADLPVSGRWRLDFYLPDPRPPGWAFEGRRSYATLGNFDMKLLADGETTPLPFDGAVARTGWNKIGEFEFATTDVRLEISSRTDGEMVIADAIRWIPLEGTVTIGPDEPGDS